jgi:GntR family transcriptional regulator
VATRAKPVAYRLLADELRDQVVGGAFGDGRQLPTEDELTRGHGLSRQTVRRAMQELVAEGLIYRVPGRGTFATDSRDKYVGQLGSLTELMSLGEDTERLQITPWQRLVDIEQASRLRQPSDEVFAVQLVRLHHDTPFCHTSVYLPLQVGELLLGPDDLAAPGGRSQVTVIELVDRSTAGPLARAEQSVTACLIPEFVIEHLRCRAGDPVLRIDRMYFNRDDQPVTLTVAYYDPARYSYRLSVGRDGR